MCSWHILYVHMCISQIVWVIINLKWWEEWFMSVTHFTRSALNHSKGWLNWTDRVKQSAQFSWIKKWYETRSTDVANVHSMESVCLRCLWGTAKFIGLLTVHSWLLFHNIQFLAFVYIKNKQTSLIFQTNRKTYGISNRPVFKGIAKFFVYCLHKTHVMQYTALYAS